jgi:hypothetical protein
LDTALPWNGLPSAISTIGIPEKSLFRPFRKSDSGQARYTMKDQINGHVERQDRKIWMLSDNDAVDVLYIKVVKPAIKS